MRMGRAAFWKFAAINLLVLWLAFPAAIFLGRIIGHDTSTMRWLLLSVHPVFRTVLMVPAAFAGFWRLHDLDKAGWPAFVTIFFAGTLPYWTVFGFAAYISGGAVREGRDITFDAVSIGSVLAMIYWPFLLAVTAISVRTIYLWCQPGEKGENRFGPAPA